MLENYLSTREAASSLNMPYSSLMKLVYRNKLPAGRRGRCWYVHKDDVEKLRQMRQA